MAIDFSKYTSGVNNTGIDFSKYTGGVSTGNIDFSKYTTGDIQPNTITPTDNILTKWAGIQNPTTYWQDAWNQVKTTVAHPIKAVENAFSAGVSSIGNALSGALNANIKLYTDRKQPFVNRLADYANAISADVGAVFSPIGAVFSVAEQIPVLKEAADVVNGVFTVTGNVIKFPVEGFIKALPIDQASKDVLSPAFGDLGALAGQIVLGGRVMEYVQGKILPVKEGEVIKPITIPKEDIVKLKEEARTYTDQAKTNLTQKVQPIEQPVIKETKPFQVDSVKVEKDATILQDKFQNDPSFQGTTFKEQSQRWNEFFKSDRQAALDAMTGKTKPPEGMVATAGAELFGKDPSLTLNELKRLKDSPMYVESKGGQELSLTRINGENTNPVKIVRDIERNMEKTAEKVTPKRETIKKIIKDITCQE